MTPMSLGLTDRRGECIYSACPHYRRCFIERAERAGREADLVIANHALVMINAARSRESAPQRIVFDEGHHLFDAADSTFAVALTGQEAIELRRWIVGPAPATQRLMCERGEADICSFPPAQSKELADAHGINKSRFFVKSQTTLWYLVMNNSRGIFQNNVNLRKAVSHAIDRRFMVAQHGYLAGQRTDQFLPYSMPGFRNFNIYSLKGPNYAAAKRLAQGNTRDGKAVMYTFNVAQGPAIAQSVQFNLKQIGVDVEIRQFDRVVQNEKSGTRGEPFDLTLEGWGMDYPDPSNFINVLLDGRRIQAEHNVNVSYFNNATINRRMDRANSLSGQARLTAYGLLDRDIMKDHAPLAPYISTNARIFTSASVGCYGYTSIQGSLLTQICKK